MIVLRQKEYGFTDATGKNWGTNAMVALGRQKSGNANMSAKDAYKFAKDSLTKSGNITVGARQTTRNVIKGSKELQSSIANIGKSGGKEAARKAVNVVESGVKAGYASGYNAATKATKTMKSNVANNPGLKTAAINTWNKMGMLSKAGTVGAAAVAGGLMLRGLLGGRKKERRGY